MFFSQYFSIIYKMFKFFKRISKNINSNFGTTKTVNAKLNRRQILIKNAVKTHKKQSKLLDNLDEETKNLLKTFAEKKIFKINEKDR